MESERAKAVESALSDAINQTAKVLAAEVSRAAQATDSVMNATQLEQYFLCEGR